MTFCGHGLRDHVRLLTPLFGLIALVWVLRLLLDAAGVSHSVVRVFSLTAATSLSILVAVWLIHTRGFGSYPNVALASLLLVVFEQLLIVLTICFAVLTKTENVFTDPKYSVPDDPNHVKHSLGQLTFGIGAGILLGTATGCLMLWLLRMMVPARVRG